MKEKTKVDQLVVMADPNHAGVRLGVLFAFGAGVVVSLFIISPLLNAILGLSGLAAFGASLVAIMLTVSLLTHACEKALRRLWPSGRTVEVTSRSITLRKGTDVSEIAWLQIQEILRWHFTIHSRRTWVPKGWLCVAVQIADNKDTKIAFYGLFKPAEANNLPNWEKFEVLTSLRRPSSTEIDGQRSESLRQAEEMRWLNGAEIEPNDFRAIVTAMSGYAPNHL